MNVRPGVDILSGMGYNSQALSQAPKSHGSTSWRGSRGSLERSGTDDEKAVQVFRSRVVHGPCPLSHSDAGYPARQSFAHHLRLGGAQLWFRQPRCSDAMCRPWPLPGGFAPHSNREQWPSPRNLKCLPGRRKSGPGDFRLSHMCSQALIEDILLERSLKLCEERCLKRRLAEEHPGQR